jgi:hypothetical protein
MEARQWWWNRRLEKKRRLSSNDKSLVAVEGVEEVEQQQTGTAQTAQ